MDEKARVKVLAGVFGAVLAFMFLKPRLMEPIESAKRELQSAERSLADAEVKESEMIQADGTIEAARTLGLPPNPLDAQRLYQSWITNLADQCRFAQLDVRPGSPGRPGTELSSVQVYVDAETDLDGLSRFLYLFEKADLQHRVSSLEISSTGATGNPRLEISLTAEGLSLGSADPRSDIFSRTWLTADLSASDSEIEVAEAADFPDKAPFQIQVGREMMTVTAIDDNRWTVKRGQEGTAATEHAADDSVFEFPTAVAQVDLNYDQFENLLNQSPFVKPAKPKTYSPRIASVLDKTIAPGEKVEMTARAEDLNPDIGEVAFAIEADADGMQIDPESGKFVWETQEDLEPKTYPVKFILTQKNNDELRLEKEVNITVKLPNEAPELTVPDESVVVIGQEFQLEPKATDDGGTEQLKYSLEGEPPAGLSIDEKTGLLTWTPAAEFKPGEYTVQVKVTDQGDPAKSTSESLKLNVKDDDAKLTRFTGSVALDGRPVAWFRNIAKNERPELGVGDRLQIAEIDAELTEIARRHVLFSDTKGVWKVNLGDNLRQRILVKAHPEPAAEEDEQAADGEPNSSDTNADYDKDPPKASDQPAEDDSPVESDSEETAEQKDSADESKQSDAAEKPSAEQDDEKEADENSESDSDGEDAPVT